MDESLIAGGRKPRVFASKARTTGASAPGYYVEFKLRAIFSQTLWRVVCESIPDAANR
jgi:hypothetical protein